MTSRKWLAKYQRGEMANGINVSINGVSSASIMAQSNRTANRLKRRRRRNNIHLFSCRENIGESSSAIS
jgi:hypothetical protein